MQKTNQKFTIPAGTKVKTAEGEYKTDREITVTASSMEKTKAGNTKITWRGHRSFKTAILKV